MNLCIIGISYILEIPKPYFNIPCILLVSNFLTPLFSLFLRKAVRATIVLLPLFGLDWLLTVYRPSNSDGGGCIWPILHRYLIVILSGARGLMVSIVFCYRNGEVILIQHLSKFIFLLKLPLIEMFPIIIEFF